MNKKLTYYLSKTHWSLLLLSGFLLQPLLAQVSFPYSQNLTTAVDPSEIRLYNDAQFVDGLGLRLTPAENSKFGAAILAGATFASNEGLKIEFEYGMYGGSGADGISVFLFDAEADNDNFEIGAKGEGLAYMYNRAKSIGNLGDRKKGLSGAYLGIGLDAWGKFKEQAYFNDKRKNGVRTEDIGEEFIKNHVTLRGAFGKGDLPDPNVYGYNGRTEGYHGYPVLISEPTNSGDQKKVILKNNGDFDITAVNNPTGFTLNTQSFGDNPSDQNYRKAIIELVPASPNGYLVTVKIQHGNTISTIIENYHYKESLRYTENANARDNREGNILGGERSDDSKHTLDASIPDNFKIGFGASTGGETNIHLIRNLKVEKLFAAEAEDDLASLSCEESVEIAVLENDFAYEGIPAVASSEYIDKTKFNFIAENGNVYTNSYIQDGVGVWSYDSDTGLVTFTKEEGFEGEASIQYSIIGRTSPYDGDDYRSLPATITVNVEHCVCTVEGNTSVPALVASTGITTLNRNSNTWLEDVNQGVNLVLESSTKPFVITRVVNVSNITEPVEGMLVWETSTRSLKLYKASGWSTLREGCNKPVLRTNQ
ncbi:hypothetical protein NLM59_00240 [Weeksellaceae bacterium KMM 9724]|uniref:hypothetical protein n=1 Tax=Profundicola chukchiensis TaxID=2961959 RepID=UPI002440230A|nr:hypothetical protein [Profundicola chukchiensis]MDG4949339.1 hypothetical protein [Profundicola chukchiensis]